MLGIMRILNMLAILFVLIFSSGCSYKLDQTTPPDDLIPKDTFTMLLYEVMVLESYYKVQELPIEQYKDHLPEAMEKVFEKYSIDSLRFRSSMDFYTTSQEELYEIYNTIQDSLIIKTVPYKVEQ